MDKDLQDMIKEVLQDYIDNGLIVTVRLCIDESAGMALRMDLLEKAISDGLKEIGDSICASISDEITVYQGDRK